MQTRKASPDELNAIYWMGFDAWGEGLLPTEYLASCQASQKYRSGVWYVLIVDNQPVSSLIVYRDQFGLGQGCFGIGSLATMPAMRGQGLDAHLLRAVTDMLLDSPDAVTTFLHADIDHHFYQRLGYRRLSGCDCMCFSHRRPHYVGEPPTYF